jgi:thiamine-phosphate diphosphorylase
VLGSRDVYARVPCLHVVTDDRVLGRTDFLSAAGAVLVVGGRNVAFHLRGPGTPAARLHAIAVALAPRAAGSGAVLLVNDRVDVALAARCDGVQLALRSLTPNDARELLGPAALIGSSVHSVSEAEAAGRSGADFLLAGSFYPTGSHPDRAPHGLETLTAIAEVPLPVVAIGGVTPERTRQLRSAGASGVAAIRGVWAAASPADAASEYLRAWSAA